MPWSPGDAQRFKKGLGRQASNRWASVANNVLSRTGDEGKAVRIANGVTKGSVARRMAKRMNQRTGVSG